MNFSLSEEAQRLRAIVQQFVRITLIPREVEFLNAPDQSQREQILKAATLAIKELGLYSAGVPKEFGGGGLGQIETCLIAEELNQTIIPVDWGEPTPILYECSEAQRPKYLLPVVRGEKRYALALLEPEPFAKLGEMKTTAVETQNGFVLNGTKELSRPDFHFCLVFARSPEGISCFILDRDTPGSFITKHEDRSRLTLDDCLVESQNLLGEPAGAMNLGKKWFGLSRLVRAAGVLGVCKRLLETAALSARNRLSTDEPGLNQNEIFSTIAEMTGDIEALRWLTYRTAWLAAEGKDIAFDYMLAKLQAQKVLMNVVNGSTSLSGGNSPLSEHWLIRASAEGEALDLLRIAIAQQVLAVYPRT